MRTLLCLCLLALAGCRPPPATRHTVYHDPVRLRADAIVRDLDGLGWETRAGKRYLHQVAPELSARPELQAEVLRRLKERD